jgi:ribosomal protein S6
MIDNFHYYVMNHSAEPAFILNLNSKILFTTAIVRMVSLLTSKKKHYHPYINFC